MTHIRDPVPVGGAPIGTWRAVAVGATSGSRKQCSDSRFPHSFNSARVVGELKYTHTVQKQKTFQVNISRKVTAYECVIIKLA